MTDWLFFFLFSGVVWGQRSCSTPFTLRESSENKEGEAGALLPQMDPQYLYAYL